MTGIIGCAKRDSISSAEMESQVKTQENLMGPHSAEMESHPVEMESHVYPPAPPG